MTARYRLQSMILQEGGGHTLRRETKNNRKIILLL